MKRLLVANRGEVAVRVLRAASGLGIGTVAVHSADDALSLHVRRADAARELPGSGAGAYLDSEAILRAAEEEGCDAIHPGYGFLSENAGFARRCAERGITFVGPHPEALELFGDKVRARRMAAECDVPVLPGSDILTGPGDAAAFMASLGRGAAVIVKAVAGGGGRGMRVVRDPAELATAVERAQAEAAASFGDGSVYVERLVERAKHIEVQIVGDHTGTVIHLGERDCSIQRRHQKLIEIAPSPGLPGTVRDRLLRAAVDLAHTAGYASLGTIEFLVDPSADPDDANAIAFIEANPRLQVEHTVTEEVTGVDLVVLQLRLASGATLAELGLPEPDAAPPKGFAVQARVNMETMTADGTARPSGGTLTAFEPPTGPGVRTDTFGYTGYQTSPRFDSLLAKVIVHSPADFVGAARLAYQALSEFRVDGVPTNIAFLQSILRDAEFTSGRGYTRLVEDRIAELTADDAHPRFFFESPGPAAAPDSAGVRTAGATVDARDPLAVLAYGKSDGAAAVRPETLPGTEVVTAPMQGTVSQIAVEPGDVVHRGRHLLVMEAMKMEHAVAAPVSGVMREIAVAVGDAVYQGAPLAVIEEKPIDDREQAEQATVDLDAIRPDLELVRHRHALTLDDARPDAVRRRHDDGGRTARENIADLCDPGTFIEYGALGLPTHMDRPHEEVIRRYPADGMITGVGAVNGTSFGDPASRCAVLAYDYTVLAGTQGRINHAKTDRLLEVAHTWRLPVVLFSEGGGGRAVHTTEPRNSAGEPVHTQVGGPADVPSWRRLGALSGLVPLVGINSGNCFAGNAALLGCCDVIIATADSSIGMAGPALVEGGGLGVYRPEEIGPLSVQVPSGVVDIAVADEAEAVRTAKRYLSYFQGPLAEWEAEDQRLLRHAVPDNRRRTYDVRKLVETLADRGSVLELRRGFGLSMITSLIRIDGRPIGLIANNPQHLAGAVDSDGADKAARFMKLCDAFGLPILSLADTPGIMVGPEAERTGLVRHTARMFVTSANLTVPMVTVVLRKAYGLGVLTMAAGSFKSTAMTVAWPTGEFGGMGLEGQVKLGSRAELAAITNPDERMRRYEELVAAAYERGGAINQAVAFGVDDVIDPADTRAVISGIFASVRPEPRDEKRWPSVDTW